MMVVRHGCRMLLLSCCYCCYQSILLWQFRVASYRTTALVPSFTRVTRTRRPERRPLEHCAVIRWWGSDSELRILQSSSRNDDDEESKNDTTTTELQLPGEAVPPTDTDDISNFLWNLEEQQQRNRGGDMNVSGSSDLPLPLFTSVLILFGSLYVTGYGIYVGLYGFPPEGDTSFVSTLPRIF